MKLKLRKYIALFLIVSLCIFSLSGCYNTRNIDKLAFIVALGIDKGEKENLKLSFQLSVPSQESGSSSSQSNQTIITTIEANSIPHGINLIDNYLSKRINMAHCKVIVFSEELAVNGISKEIFTLMNDVEVRPDSNIVVSKCNAEYFLNNSKPVLEKLSARYYETVATSSEYTGYSEDMTLSRFFSDLNDTLVECHAILGNVNTSDSISNSSENPIDTNTTYSAGETPIGNTTNTENMGLAVFHHDRLVGELNAIETLCHMIITNKVETFKLTIPNPFKNGDTIDLNMRLNKKTKSKAKLVNSSPYIETNINLCARIVSIDENSEYLKNENLHIIQDYINSYMESKITKYLYKTSIELNSDIDKFGKSAITNFLFWDDWKNSNWLENYKNSFFKVNLSTRLQSSYQLLQT